MVAGPDHLVPYFASSVRGNGSGAASACDGSHLVVADSLGGKIAGACSARRSSPHLDAKDRSAVWPRLRIFPNGPQRSRLKSCLPASTRPTVSARCRSRPTARIRRRRPRPRPSPSSSTSPATSVPPRAASWASSSARRRPTSPASTSTADSASARPTCSPRCGTWPRAARPSAPSSNTPTWSARCPSARRSRCSAPTRWSASMNSSWTTRGTPC